MDRALVVANDSAAGRRLLAEAGDLAAGVGAELTVLGIVDRDEYTNELQRQANRGTRKLGSLEEVTDGIRRDTAELAAPVLDNADVEYEVVGLVGDPPNDILAEAEARECDHIFIVGRRRSPTGKVVFGDVAQSVILNYDGPVTVVIEEER